MPVTISTARLGLGDGSAAGDEDAWPSCAACPLFAQAAASRPSTTVRRCDMAVIMNPEVYCRVKASAAMLTPRSASET